MSHWLQILVYPTIQKLKSCYFSWEAVQCWLTSLWYLPPDASSSAAWLYSSLFGLADESMGFVTYNYRRKGIILQGTKTTWPSLKLPFVSIHNVWYPTQTHPRLCFLPAQLSHLLCVSGCRGTWAKHSLLCKGKGWKSHLWRSISFAVLLPTLKCTRPYWKTYLFFSFNHWKLLALEKLVFKCWIEV